MFCGMIWIQQQQQQQQQHGLFLTSSQLLSIADFVLLISIYYLLLEFITLFTENEI